MRRCRRGWDHPRSRGVYSTHHCGRLLLVGSSPLARGLPGFAFQPGWGGGIIPARAGFTWRSSSPRRSAPDHPRSRGVYAALRAEEDPAPGSSPLARGLLDPAPGRQSVLRIIPARAGFTRTFVRCRGWVLDHPRSRGVYRTGESNPRRRPGSSPLARGLRDMEGARGRTRRIIPARAGFTPHRQRLRRPSQDHPRSRGVYYNASHDPNNEAGSSPLARGLRQAVVDNTGRPGIIPARAGFTRSCPGPSPWRTDHPRSRGVYSTARVRGAVSPGSSPLARGLPALTIEGGGASGIIPARAGFTRSLRPAGTPSADHPRSRGVYPSASALWTPTSGSSPLARGLRSRRNTKAASRGIIPARAGFTIIPLFTTFGTTDHPRSRGVYDLRYPADGGSRGSSPLARGLLLDAGLPDGDEGIIPARAGFTSVGSFSTSSQRDHPRSRGVYEFESQTKL